MDVDIGLEGRDDVVGPTQRYSRDSAKHRLDARDL